MSGVDRYEVTEGGGLFKCDGGDLVFFDDYDQLAADNKRLEGEVARLKSLIQYIRDSENTVLSVHLWDRVNAALSTTANGEGAE